MTTFRLGSPTECSAHPFNAHTEGNNFWFSDWCFGFFQRRSGSWLSLDWLDCKIKFASSLPILVLLLTVLYLKSVFIKRRLSPQHNVDIWNMAKCESRHLKYDAAGGWVKSHLERQLLPFGRSTTWARRGVIRTLFFYNYCFYFFNCNIHYFGVIRIRGRKRKWRWPALVAGCKRVGRRISTS